MSAISTITCYNCKNETLKVKSLVTKDVYCEHCHLNLSDSINYRGSFSNEIELPRRRPANCSNLGSAGQAGK